MLRCDREPRPFIDLEEYFESVILWILSRPAIVNNNTNFETLIGLLLGEIEEVEWHRLKEGTPGYKGDEVFKEAKELSDVLCVLASLILYFLKEHEWPDFKQVLLSVNSQSAGSNAIEQLKETAGNMRERSLKKDFIYLLILLVSYLEHMDGSFNLNEILSRDILPKNSHNYPKELLAGNALFERRFNRPMDREETQAYYDHFLQAVRVIRKFVVEHIDPQAEFTGLDFKFIQKYLIYILSFIPEIGLGLNSAEVINGLKLKLHRDFNVPYRDEKVFMTPGGVLVPSSVVL